MSCLKTNWRFAFSVPLRAAPYDATFGSFAVVPEAPAQADNGRQAHLVHYLFYSVRGTSQHDRPASCPSPAPVVGREVRVLEAGRVATVGAGRRASAEGRAAAEKRQESAKRQGE